MIIFVMICHDNQFYNLPLPPCTFTLTTIYKVNCCTFMFNMSRIALKRNNTVITIKRNKNYIAPIINDKMRRDEMGC